MTIQIEIGPRSISPRAEFAIARTATRPPRTRRDRARRRRRRVEQRGDEAFARARYRRPAARIERAGEQRTPIRKHFLGGEIARGSSTSSKLVARRGILDPRRQPPSSNSRRSRSPGRVDGASSTCGRATTTARGAARCEEIAEQFRRGAFRAQDGEQSTAPGMRASGVERAHAGRIARTGKSREQPGTSSVSTSRRARCAPPSAARNASRESSRRRLRPLKRDGATSSRSRIVADAGEPGCPPRRERRRPRTAVVMFSTRRR